jgi:hypothetical protein
MAISPCEQAFLNGLDNLASLFSGYHATVTCLIVDGHRKVVPIDVLVFSLVEDSPGLVFSKFDRWRIVLAEVETPFYCRGSGQRQNLFA